MDCQAPLALLSSVRKRLSSRNGMLHTRCCVRAYTSASSSVLVSSNGERMSFCATVAASAKVAQQPFAPSGCALTALSVEGV